MQLRVAPRYIYLRREYVSVNKRYERNANTVGDRRIASMRWGCRRMDGWTDGWMDGWMGRNTLGRTYNAIVNDAVENRCISTHTRAPKSLNSPFRMAGPLLLLMANRPMCRLLRTPRRIMSVIGVRRLARCILCEHNSKNADGRLGW